MKLIIFLFLLLVCFQGLRAQQDSAAYNERYRPQLHFSPKAHWMNDPNGMVHYRGTWHLFFQYYPGGTVWGPMHWGHAESKDLVHWRELPVAIAPDSSGYIFSGSAVVDSLNTSGFATGGKIPLVAIYTRHDAPLEKTGAADFENQCIAYSLDHGVSWTKYGGNPVLKNPGIRDFRDPKVMWYAPQHKWIMTLAVQDHISFYSSPDLKNWKPESEFGKTAGAHTGVWECPDLFPMKFNGKEYWILIVNINPGGPNGGSATQYFVGQFNGAEFTPHDSKIRWMDYGPDEYAGVTWCNTGDRRVFLGWMSNWAYAEKVPTERWRSAMTVPRELSLKSAGGELFVASTPITETQNIMEINVTADPSRLSAITRTKTFGGQFMLKMKTKKLHAFTLKLSNKKGEQLLIGFDSQTNRYFTDRTKSGKTDFDKNFAGRFTAPRLSTSPATDMTLVIDRSSVELFADDGLTVMTVIDFPSDEFTQLDLLSPEKLKISFLSLTQLESIWRE